MFTPAGCVQDALRDLHADHTCVFVAGDLIQAHRVDYIDSRSREIDHSIKLTDHRRSVKAKDDSHCRIKLIWALFTL